MITQITRHAEISNDERRQQIRQRHGVALTCWARNRTQLAYAIAQCQQHGSDPRLIPGLRRMIGACRQARLIASVIELELHAA